MELKELQEKWLQRGITPKEQKRITTDEILKKHTKVREEPKSFDFDDPAEPGFFQTIFREPIELGKTLAMTPGMIRQFEETEMRRGEMIDKIMKKYRTGEIDSETFQRLGTYIKPQEVPEGIMKTPTQIIGDVFGTLLWLTPIREIKALRGLSTISKFARGSALGGTFAAARGMSENAEPVELAKRVGLGAALGGPIEVAAPVFFRGVGKILRKSGELIGKGLQPVWERLAPVSYRLEKLGPMGKRMTDLLYSMDEKFGVKAGTRLEKLEDAGLLKFNKSERFALVDALEGRIKPQGLTDKVRKVYQVADTIRKEIAEEASQRIPGWKPLPNHYPHIIHDINILGKKGGKIREEFLENAVRIRAFKNKGEAEIVLDSWIEFVRTGGRQGNYWKDYLVRTGQAKNRNEAVKLTNEFLTDLGLKTRLGKEARFGKFGQLELQRKINFPFYDPDPTRTLPTYIIGATGRLEQITSLGAKGETFNKLVGQLRAELEKEGRTADIRKLQRLIDTIFPIIQAAPDKEKISMFLRAIQIPKLAFAQMLNIGQGPINTLLATDLPSVGFGIKKAFTREGSKQALRSGAILDSTFREMQSMIGGDMAFSTWFLKWTGFSWTEKINRTIAANAGMQYALRLQNQLKRNPANKLVAQQLQEIKISPLEAIKRDLTEDELLRAGQLVASATQFRARPLDLPRFVSSPEGKVIFQFKNFVYNQTLFLKRQLWRKDIRALRNLFLLATVFPIAGEVLGNVRSLVTGSTRPTRFLDRYFENIAMVGGIGIAMDIFESARFGRLAEFAVGPTASTFINLLERLTKIATTGEVTDADIRWLGQQAGPARMLTNYLFPPENPLRKTILDQIKEEW